MQMLAIEIVDSPAQAPNYRRDRVDVRTVAITKAIIVLGGMESGRATVDFQIKDEQGAEFVAILTGDLVKSLAQAIIGAEARR